MHTNNYAEYRGLIANIAYAISIGAEEVEFVMDSQLVIRQMTGQYKVRSEAVRGLHDDAVALCAQIPKVSFRNVRRSQELVPRADALLNAEMDRHAGRRTVLNPPGHVPGMLDYPTDPRFIDDDAKACFEEASRIVQADRRDQYARVLLRKGASRGDVACMMLLGNLLFDGSEDEQREAFDLFQAAADMGDSGAMRNVGYCYALGRGTERDKEYAAMWYTRAADAGNPRAACNIGVMYDYGNGVKKSPVMAVAWFKRGAEGGSTRAMTNLGEHLVAGDGIERDLDEAERLFIESGSPRATYRLAELYLDTEEKRDPAKGQEMLEKAASMKYSRALYRYGAQIEREQPERAVEMYKEASAKGNKEAADRLRELGIEAPESRMAKKRRERAEKEKSQQRIFRSGAFAAPSSPSRRTPFPTGTQGRRGSPSR